MRVFLFFLFLSQADADTTPVDGSVTNAISAPCEKVKVSQGTLEICDLSPGGIFGPTYLYKLNGKVFKGQVKKLKNGTYTLEGEKSLNSILTPKTYSGPRVPDKFSCADKGNNNDEFQCLVCTCFFEARGNSFEEQVLVNRVVLSRVLNPNFPNNVCDVVHNRSPKGVPNFSFVSQNKQNKVFKSAYGGNKKFPVNVVLGEGSPDLSNMQKESLRKCVRSSSVAQQYRDQYFASYYFVRGISVDWAKKCDKRAKKNSVSDNLIDSSEYTHVFRRFCEDNEFAAFKNAISPPKVLVSPRPPEKPSWLFSTRPEPRHTPERPPRKSNSVN